MRREKKEGGREGVIKKRRKGGRECYKEVERERESLKKKEGREGVL